MVPDSRNGSRVDEAIDPPADWPYAEQVAVCAACGRGDDRSVAVDSLGLVWGAAMAGGLPATELDGYAGTLEFRCCHDCWIHEGVRALDGARTLLDGKVRASGPRPFALDDERVAAAARLDAERVAVGRLRRLDTRSDPEREHVRSQDEAVEALLDSWFDRV